MDYVPTKGYNGMFEKHVAWPGASALSIPTVIVDVNDMYLITYGCKDLITQVQEINFYTRDLTRGRCLDVDVDYMIEYAGDMGVKWDSKSLVRVD